MARLMQMVSLILKKYKSIMNSFGDGIAVEMMKENAVILSLFNNTSDIIDKKAALDTAKYTAISQWYASTITKPSKATP